MSSHCRFGNLANECVENNYIHVSRKKLTQNAEVPDFDIVLQSADRQALDDVGDAACRVEYDDGVN